MARDDANGTEERAVTEHEWHMALIAAWKADKPIIYALRVLDGSVFFAHKGKLNSSDVTPLLAMVRGLRPGLIGKNGHERNVAQPVKVFIDAVAPAVSDALWSGDEKKAARLLPRYSGLDRNGNIIGAPTLRRYERTEMTNEYRRNRGVRTIKSRTLTKWHDWKTVK